MTWRPLNWSTCSSPALSFYLPFQFQPYRSQKRPSFQLAYVQQWEQEGERRLGGWGGGVGDRKQNRHFCFQTQQWYKCCSRALTAWQCPWNLAFAVDFTRGVRGLWAGVTSHLGGAETFLWPTPAKVYSQLTTIMKIMLLWLSLVSQERISKPGSFQPESLNRFLGRKTFNPSPVKNAN